MNAEAFWCSPLTRAVQTALVGLEPVLRMPGKRLELKINAREKKSRGGWKGPSTLSEDSAPSASPDHLKARAAPARPGAPPEQLGSSPAARARLS